MRMKLLIIFCVIHLRCYAQQTDWSFREMCKFWEGGDTYKPRSKGWHPMTGDICEFKFPYAAENDDDAKVYCETNVPYHIRSVASTDQNTICTAEATLICAPGWVQMFGRCYKMKKELMTREEAGGYCSGQKQSKIAFMHREALPFRIRDYYSNVSRLWLDASEAITHDLIYNVEGGNLLLAIDGYNYNLPNLALARVRTTEKAMALCEYTPPMNQAESNYLLRRYGEIYYPTIFTKDTAYVRSASSLQRADGNLLHDNNYCKRVLRPFLQTDDAQSAVPTREFLEKLAEKRRAEIIRTSVYSGDAVLESRINEVCSSSDSRYYGMDFPTSGNQKLFKTMKDEPIWRKDEPEETCDGASWSTGIVLSRSSDIGLEAMSDARYAPIYCQTTFDTVAYARCHSDWNTFHRGDNEQRWCHRFFAEKVTFKEAEKRCRAEGAHVSGFSDEEELKLLDKMLDAAARKGTKFGGDDNVWIGARRRESCTREGMDSPDGGFNSNPTHQCSRLRVFEWVNGAAKNPPDLLTRWIAPKEPNFVGDDEKCVQLLKGTQNRYGWEPNVKGDQKFNDVPCDLKLYFLCGKEANIVSTSI